MVDRSVAAEARQWGVREPVAASTSFCLPDPANPRNWVIELAHGARAAVDLIVADVGGDEALKLFQACTNAPGLDPMASILPSPDRRPRRS